MSTTPVVLRNAADAYVFLNKPSANFDGSVNLVVRAAGSSLDCASYIYFSRPFPLGATIQSATLRLYQKTAESLTHTVTLRRLTSWWSNSKITWNNVPTATSTGQVQVTKAAPADATEWAFDVAAHLQLIADGGAMYGWVLTTNQNDYLHWHSASAASLKPVLEVTWSTAPEAPTTLSPSGNRAVSVAKPILRFDFTDRAGNTQLQAVQVQLNATNVWTGPSFDSGTVLTSDAQLDLAATAYAGLAAGASTYWRVRVQDGSGLWSPWSAGVQFQRQTKGTVTITNPPVSGLISEPTPPIIWTFTGRTQTAWLVYVSPAADTTTVLYNSGKVTGTQTSHTLPAGVLKDDTSYNAHVWIWDEISRENTPNDPAVTPATRALTYDYDATVDPVTSLVVTDLSPKPVAQITWSRATAPDSFLMRRNGVIVSSDMDPAAFSTGGTNYTRTDPSADPQVPNTWSIQAVVNGKTSANNPEVTVTLRPQGIWLMDWLRGIDIQLVETTPTGTMGEQAESYTPVGGSKVVRITQALRGLEGSVTGRIIDSSTGTVAQKEADLYTLKSTPGRVYYLTLANQSVPVVIGNLAVTPLNIYATQGKAVSFDFWSTKPPFTAVL